MPMPPGRLGVTAMAKAREPLLEGSRVTLRRAVERDLEPLVALIQEPGVARWWGSYDAPAGPA